VGGDLANQFSTQLDQLSKRLEQVTAKAKVQTATR